MFDRESTSPDILVVPVAELRNLLEGVSDDAILVLRDAEGRLITVKSIERVHLEADSLQVLSACDAEHGLDARDFCCDSHFQEAVTAHRESIEAEGRPAICFSIGETTLESRRRLM